jgi:hypothetical protein
MNLRLPLALLSVSIIIAAGCDLGPVGQPPPLTKKEVRKVLSCQEAVKEEGRHFTKVKLAGVEECLDKVLEAQLEFENGLISESQFNQKLDKIRKDCRKEYREIRKASKELVDEIIDECGPVEAIVFSDYDPLKFDALSSFNGTLFNPSVQDLAGWTCGVKEIIVDFAIFFQVPRMYELLGILGEEFYIELGDVRIPHPELILDPRCFVAEQT